MDLLIKETLNSPTAYARLVDVANQPATARTLSKDSDNQRLVYGAGSSRAVGALVIEPSAGCVLPLEFENRSEPFFVGEGHAFCGENGMTNGLFTSVKCNSAHNVYCSLVYGRF